MDVIYLSPTSASVFRRRLPLYGASIRTPQGVVRGYPVAYIPYAPSYTGKRKPCLLCGMFGARSSSGTDHNISRKECVTLVDAWGTCGSRERCLGSGGVGYWIISMSLELRFRHTCDDALDDNSLLYRNGANILPLPCGKFNPPSHTSTVGVSCRTCLEFGG